MARESKVDSLTAASDVKSSARSRGSISGIAIASYVGVFLLVVTLVMIGYQPPVRDEAVANSVPTTGSNTIAFARTSVEVTGIDGVVDRVTATTLASSLAETTDMPVRYEVSNLSQTLAIASSLEQTDANMISKPTVVQPAANNSSMQQYTTVEGDTVDSVAAKFNVSANTIKWANGLTSSSVSAGRALQIPPVDGVVYTVRSGDTIDTIASRYKGDRNEIVIINNLELSGLPAVGSKIIIPGGDLPTVERPGYVAPTPAPAIGGNWNSGGTWAPAHAWGGNRGSYQGYPFGQCTWYAAFRRAQLGNPVGNMWGNGGYWRVSGARAGRPVDNNPAPGAVMDGLGHVAIVESIEPGNRILISEMNGYRGGGGWGRVGYVVISWSEATSGLYRYVH